MGLVWLLDARSGKTLAGAGMDEVCSPHPIPVSWRKSWQAYSPQEQAQIESAFKAAMDLRIRVALTDMGIGIGAQRTSESR